jgi:uncharacterized membrane protein
MEAAEVPLSRALVAGPGVAGGPARQQRVFEQVPGQTRRSVAGEGNTTPTPIPETPVSSKAQPGDRPLHPVLVPFPLVLLLGTFFADAASAALGVPGLWITAWYLGIAGVVAGVVAAAAGLFDFLVRLPRVGAARRRALVHPLVNVVALALFALAWFVRGAVGVPPDPALLLIEGVAAVLLAVGAWLGRRLARRVAVAARADPS